MRPYFSRATTSPAPTCAARSRGYFFSSNFSAAPFMQKRSPVG